MNKKKKGNTEYKSRNQGIKSKRIQKINQTKYGSAKKKINMIDKL